MTRAERFEDASLLTEDRGRDHEPGNATRKLEKAKKDSSLEPPEELLALLTI